MAATLAADDSFFREKVEPIFDKRCRSCHNDGLKFSGLSLDSAERLQQGGLRGAVVKPGAPDASRLYRRVTGVEKPRMPMDADPLSEAEVAILRQWIENGAEWPVEEKQRSEAQAKVSRLAALKKIE